MTDDPTLHVLFVCTANICRSPWLELTARTMARTMAGPGADVEFASAGVRGFDDHPMDPTVAATLPPGAADGFRSRPLRHHLLEAADLVLTAEAAHRALILEEHPGLFRKVFTVGQFAAIAEANPGLSRSELVEVAGRRRTPARDEHDIADPYRRGEEAVRRATGIMSTMLSVIVPRLVAGTARPGEGS